MKIAVPAHRISFVVISIFVIAVCSACQDPFPVGTTVEVAEDAQKGSVVLDLGASSDIIWSLSVKQPASHSSQLVTYFLVTSRPSQPTWLLVLDKQLDLEQIYTDYSIDLATITLDLTCQNTKSGMQVPYSGVIAVTPVSEFAPVFLPRALLQEVPEDAEINSVVFDLRPMVSDADVYRGSTDIDEFGSSPSSDNLPDGGEVFDVASDGKVRLLQSLDFDEGERTFSLNVTVKDIGGLSSHAAVRINVRNVNDNSPVFDFSGCSGQDCAFTEYKATVDPQYTGSLTSIIPNAITAQDADLDQVSYRFLSGSPVNFSSYLQIDEASGVVTFSQPVADLNIGHFSVTVEAADGNGSTQATTDYNSATCVLLILVSGRETDFPAVIGQSTSSDDRDDWFISTVCLASFCAVVLILLLVLAVWICCLRRDRQKLNMSNSPDHVQNSKKNRTTKPGNTLMRSVHSDSERRFMRELSASDVRVGKDNPAFQDASVFFETQNNSGAHDDDDVFVTDIESYFNLQGVLQSSETRPARISTPELIAFHDALPSHNSGRLSQHSPNNLLEISNSSHPNGGTTQTLNPRNLESQYKAIDLLTTVVPLNEVDSTPAFSSFLSRDGQGKDITPASSSAGTCRSLRSMRDADVIGELEDLVTGNRRTPSPVVAPPSPLILPPHLHGYLPEDPGTRNPLDEAVTIFPSSPHGHTTSTSLRNEQNTSHGVTLDAHSANKSSNLDENSNKENGSSSVGFSGSADPNRNRFISSMNLTPTYSLSNSENTQSMGHQSGLNADTTAQNGAVGSLSASQHSLGFEPSQPYKTTDSVPKSSNQTFFTVNF